jgi:hypothetical protein
VKKAPLDLFSVRGTCYVHVCVSVCIPHVGMIQMRERERENPIMSHNKVHFKALKINYKSKCFGEVCAIRYDS